MKIPEKAPIQVILRLLVYVFHFFFPSCFMKGVLNVVDSQTAAGVLERKFLCHPEIIPLTKPPTSYDIKLRGGLYPRFSLFFGKTRVRFYPKSPSSLAFEFTVIAHRNVIWAFNALVYISSISNAIRLPSQELPHILHDALCFVLMSLLLSWVGTALMWHRMKEVFRRMLGIEEEPRVVF